MGDLEGKKKSSKCGDFGAFFLQKNPLYESHWIFLSHQVMKICPSKKPSGYISRYRMPKG
jgi:hypothetical protein